MIRALVFFVFLIADPIDVSVEDLFF